MCEICAEMSVLSYIVDILVETIYLLDVLAFVGVTFKCFRFELLNVFKNIY